MIAVNNTEITFESDRVINWKTRTSHSYNKMIWAGHTWLLITFTISVKMKGIINNGYDGKSNSNMIEDCQNMKKQTSDRVEGWDFFEEDAKDRRSVSERKYNKSLLKKYKILKVSSMISF